MRPGDTAGRLGAILETLTHRARGICEDIAQPSPVHELHRDEPRPIGLAHFVHGGDVGMIQRCGRSGLLREARPEYLSDAPAVEDLQCDMTIEPRIVRLVHVRAATRSETIDDAVLRV